MVSLCANVSVMSNVKILEHVNSLSAPELLRNKRSLCACLDEVGRVERHRAAVRPLIVAVDFAVAVFWNTIKMNGHGHAGVAFILAAYG